jgi:polyisoprenoid-binding protein YceI
VSRACAALALAMTIASAPAPADPAAYRIDGSRTRAEFTIEHLGVFQAHGRFAQVSGRLVLDATAHVGSIELDIAASSVATGWDMRDKFIRGETLFHAAQYPRVRFRSTHFEFAGDRLVRVEGNLTLRDVTRRVALTVRKMECGSAPEGCAAEAEGTIRRREFAMDAWWPLIGDDVELRFHLFAVRE